MNKRVTVLLLQHLPLKHCIMATTKRNTKNRKPTNPMPVEKDPAITVQKVVKDERIHKIIGFFLILLALWLAIAFVSYIFTWQTDQDKVFKAGGDFLFADDIKVENRLGRLGAWAGHLFIYKGFGLASFFLCILPFTIGVNLIFKKKIFRIWRNVFYALTGLIYFSVTLAFASQGAAFSYGGGWGEWISESLEAFLGKAGTILLLLVAGFAWFIWRFNPVFNVPKVPVVTRPSFFSRNEKANLEIETEDEIEETNAPALVPGIVTTPPLTAVMATTPIAAPTQKTPAALTIPSAGTSTGLSINELYAQGMQEELAKRNKFQIQDDPNPLDQQPVQGGANSLLGDENSISVIMPEVSKRARKDPMNTFTVSDKLDADIPLTVLPGKEEEVFPGTFTKDDLEEIPPTGESQIKPTHVQLPEETQPPLHSKRTLEYPVTVVPDSELELEIKPSAEFPKEEKEEDKEDEEEEDVVVPESVNKKTVENLEPYDPKLDLKGYQYPSLDLLDLHGTERIVTDAAELEAHKNQILTTLKNYDILIQRISATVGPTVTLYEIVPAPGVRISRIKNLEDDIALSLAALGIRIIAPIPGRGTIGIEVPNVRKTIVSMRTLLASEKFQNSNFSLPIAIGKKIDNEHFVVDLASMPHLLMAGATGQGKSVGINALLVSLLYKKHPSQLKFVLVDPKKVELSLYRAIERHFLAKLPGEEEAIITDTKKVVHTLNALCIEMDNRYDLLKEAGVRNIREYNEKFVKRRLNPEKGHQFLPFIVLVIDEFADLIMTAGKEIEMPIARLAQLARAVGIHLIIATQRPSVNIITGTIKANFPSRIAFKVSSKIDSRTILDAGGAEQLIGKGDMLISHNGELIRLQCAFVDTPEVERVCEAIGEQRGYPDAFLLPEYVDEKDMASRELEIGDRDTLFADAARLIVTHQQGSTSLIQRRMKLGYNRAGRLMDQLEQAGIVGPNQGSKPRDVLVKTDMDLQELLNQ